MIELRILHLEDNAHDAEIIRTTLQTSGINCRVNRVETREDFKAALKAGQYDFILSDFSMPGFDGMRALKEAQEIHPKTPFVFVSGTIGEDRAVESLNQGALDYVVKDRIQRLPAALKRIYNEQNEREIRRQRESTLEANDALFREITSHVDDLIAILRCDGSSKYLSPSYESIIGKAPGENADFFSLIHPDDRDKAREAFIKACATLGPVVTRFRIVRKDHEVMHFESHLCRTLEDQGKAKEVVAISRDITERIAAERASKEHAQLLSQTHDAIYVVDLQSRITYWNAGAQRLYGWTPEETIGQPASEFLASPTAQTLQNLGVASGGEWSGNFKDLTKEGKEVWVCRRGTILRDDSGAPEAILNISFDISVQKALEEQVLRTQRTDSIGALASGIAHDLNNLLVPILMAGELLLATDDRPENARMLRLIVESAKRGVGVVKQILQFARGEGRRNVAIDFKKIVEELSHLLVHTFPRAVLFEPTVADIQVKVMGDQGQVHQVLLNLCVNARDAMGPNGGSIFLTVREVTLTERSFPMSPKPVSGSFVEICVSDKGCGIPEDVLPHIFEPFYTTKSGAGGTGLGLSTVLTIIRNHAGYLDVKSQVGEGTSFFVYLPVSLENSDRAPERQEAATGNGECVLLVDSDHGILEMTKELLEARQFQVLCAQSAAEALIAFEKHGTEIRAVVADLSTQSLAQERLLETVRTTSPGTIVLCLSASSAALPPNIQARPDVYLTKPCSIDSLSLSLANALKTGRSIS